MITVAVAAGVSAGAWLFGSEGGGGLEAATPHPFAVAEVVDGDTIRLLNGRRVRLLQIDAPELGLARECYGASSRLQLARMLTGHVRLEFDPALDRVDRYGRQLAYVFVGRTNVNLSMVRRGAARTSFYRGERGRYSKRLLRAERAARVARRGLWGACKRPRPIVARNALIGRANSGSTTKRSAPQNSTRFAQCARRLKSCPARMVGVSNTLRRSCGCKRAAPN